MERTYKHKSGVEFDIGLIEGHDITVIMLYAIAEENEPMDEGFWLIDYVWGDPDGQDEQYYEDLIDAWLTDKPKGFVDMLLRRQAAAFN